MKIQNALVSNILDRSQRYFAHLTTVTLSWRVQNIVVIGRVYFTLECFEFSSNFEFDRNMLSGTGASTHLTNFHELIIQILWKIMYALILTHSGHILAHVIVALLFCYIEICGLIRLFYKKGTFFSFSIISTPTTQINRFQAFIITKLLSFFFYEI